LIGPTHFYHVLHQGVVKRKGQACAERNTGRHVTSLASLKEQHQQQQQQQPQKIGNTGSNNSINNNCNCNNSNSNNYTNNNPKKTLDPLNFHTSRVCN
jgi:hypothetical protein